MKWQAGLALASSPVASWRATGTRHISTARPQRRVRRRPDGPLGNPERRWEGEEDRGATLTSPSVLAPRPV